MFHRENTLFPMPQTVSLKRLFIPLRYARTLHSDAGNEVLHIIEGSMVLHLQSGEEYPAGKNDTLFIPHDVMHRDIFKARTGLEMFHINFRWKEADLFFSKASPDCLSRLPAMEKNEVLLLFDMFRMNPYVTENDALLADGRLAHLLAIAWRNVAFTDLRKDLLISPAPIRFIVHNKGCLKKPQ